MTTGNQLTTAQVDAEINTNFPDEMLGEITPAIMRQMLADISVSYVNYNDTQSANRFLASPNGSSGNSSFRALVGADLPNNGANPSGSVGLSAVNGSATTWMRSDAAPALSQAIAPTWTGTHIWTTAPSVQITGGTADFFVDDVTGTNNAEIQFQGAGASKWELGKDGNSNFFIYDDTAGADVLGIVKGAGGIVTWARPVTISANANPGLLIDNPNSGNFSVLDFSTNGAVKAQVYWDDTAAHFNITTLTAAGTITLLPNNSAALSAFASGGVAIGTTVADPGLGGLYCTNFQTQAHDTASGTTFSIAKFCTLLSPSGTLTITFPSASSFTGRWVLLRHSNNQAVNSAASNFVRMGGTSAGSEIFPANSPNAWVLAQSDGTNWVAMAASDAVWQGWTPSPAFATGTGVTATLTVNSARFCRQGDTVNFSLDISISASGSIGSPAATAISFTSPTSVAHSGGLSGREVVNTGQGVSGGIPGSGAGQCIFNRSAGSNMQLSDRYVMSGSYEAST